MVKMLIGWGLLLIGLVVVAGVALPGQINGAGDNKWCKGQQ